jgi:choline dehydrogenase
VDSLGRVRGVDRLRVVDASIIPEVPSATTNVTVIMVAERISQLAYASTPAVGALQRERAG